MGADIIEKLADGRELVFPAGTSPEVIARVKGRLLATTDAPNPPAIAIGAPQRSPATPASALESLATSPPGRMVAGAVLDRVNPMAEAAVRGANALGLAPDSGVRDVQGRNRGMSDAYAEARGVAGQSGVDIPRIAGSAALDFFATRGALGHLGKPHIASPRNLKDIAIAGGVAGGAAGAAAPVDKTEELDNLDFLIQKLVQTGIGGAIGAGAAPLVTAATEAGMGLAARGVSKLKNLVRPSDALKLTTDVRMLETYLSAQAAAAGVNWTSVPETVRESLRQATKRATEVTGKLPDAAIRNRLVAERENLPQLTTGQVTRDPVQFSREQNLPDEELRAHLGQQQLAATQRMRQSAEGFGPERTPYEVGDLVGSDIARQAATRKKAIGDLYDAARSTEGKSAAIKNIGEWAQDTEEELRRLNLINGAKGLRTNHPDIYDAVSQMNGRVGATSRMTIEKAVDTLQGINAIGTQNDPALAIVKSKLQKFLDERAVFHDQDVGTAAVKAFGEARKSRAEMGRWEESSAAIKDLAARDPATAREQIFQKFVVNGRVDDFRSMWGTLTEPSQQAIRREFVDRISKMALGRTGSDMSNYGRAIEFLGKFPPEKLKTMFPGDELKRIRGVLEYARLTREAPAGNFVNRSNTSQALLDVIGSTRNVPILGPQVTAPLAKLRDQVATRGALSTSLGLPRDAWYTPGPKLQEFSEDVGPYIAPAAVAPFTGSQD